MKLLYALCLPISFSTLANCLPWPDPAPRAFDFSKVTKAFIFGDSWSRIGFSASGTQPSDSNPLGNERSTSSNGKNWVQYITTTYNSSAFYTYDFAQGGATIDTDIVASGTDTDVDRQVSNTFLPIYANQSGFVSGSSSLFAIWIGINDLANSYLDQDAAIPPALFARLQELVYQMYDAGARQFIFLGTPPLERAPRTTQSSANATRVPLMKAAVTDYNERMYCLARKVNHDLAHTTVFYFDTYSLMTSVIDNPSQFTETSVYLNTATYCDAYKNGTPDVDTKYASCTYAANQYLWINSLHPTQPFHELLAKKVAELLRSGASL